MFRLRCEMQAMSEYAEQNDQAGMNKWIKRLEKDDIKISDMVSEWEKIQNPGCCQNSICLQAKMIRIVSTKH